MSRRTSSSVASRIDPVAKLSWLFIVSIAGSALTSTSELLLATVLVVASFALCSFEEIRSVWRYRLIIFFVPSLLLIYHAVIGPFSAGQSVNFSNVRWDSGSYSLKILNSVLALVFFICTTEVRQLVGRLANLGVPVRPAFAVYLMLRFVEILRVDAASVRDAIRLHRNARRLRFSRYPATLVLLGMHRAEQTAVAMDLRGFPGAGQRTYYGCRRWSRWGWLLPAITTSILLLTYISDVRLPIQ